jgi:hypothetical protein
MTTINETWDSEFASLLDDLSSLQSELLDVLNQKRKRLSKPNLTEADELQPKEIELVNRLQVCQTRRQQLLDQASADGQPAKNLRAVVRSFPAERRKAVEPQILQVQSQTRLLQHQALTNWVIAQKTLIHLSQLLEIIATGGRLQPTYGMIGTDAPSGGALLDQVG